MKRIIFYALFLASCGGAARVAEPAAIYDEVTAEEYDLAEAHFSGEGGTKAIAKSVAISYWDDEKCRELLNKRDGCLIAAASLGVLTGAGGLVTALPPDASREMRMGIGYATVGIAAATAALALAVTQMNNRYEMWCRQERPEPYEHPASDEVESPEESDGGVE